MFYHQYIFHMFFSISFSRVCSGEQMFKGDIEKVVLFVRNVSFNHYILWINSENRIGV